MTTTADQLPAFGTRTFSRVAIGLTFEINEFYHLVGRRQVYGGVITKEQRWEIEAELNEVLDILRAGRRANYEAITAGKKGKKNVRR